jgi:hypothetical protein
MDENKDNVADTAFGASAVVKEILGALPKTSGIDEGMVDEEYKHRTLLLSAYIATLLERIELELVKILKK